MQDVLALIGEVGVVAAVQIPRVEDAVPLCEALLAGGLPCVEITFRTPAAAASIAAVRAALPEMLVGAGTVLTTADVDAALAAGASFLVAPGFNSVVVAEAQARGALFIPGVATPSEIESALANGLGFLKFFPAEVFGGVSFLKAIHGPYPAVRFIPSGGISTLNLATYLTLPNVLACSGSWMAPVKAVETRDFPNIKRLAREAVDIVRRTRSSSVVQEGTR